VVDSAAMKAGSPTVLKPDSQRGVVSFGAFEVDLSAGEVRKHGYKVKLQDQPFRVLEALLRHPGEVVTREDLQQQIWPADTFVDFDRGLNNAVKRLREALGDSAETPRFVETLPRRGYRFIASTNGVSGNGHGTAVAEAPPQKRPGTWTRLAWITALSVLVLLTLALQYWRSGRPELKSLSELKSLKVVASAAENPVNYAAISPDGRSIAYTDASGIHVKVIETGETRTIPPPARDGSPSSASSAAVRFPVTWYPDGTRLLVSTGTPRSTTSGPVIWAISLITGNAQKLYEGAWASEVSPDGSSIAAVKDESEIWLMGPRGEEPHQFATAGAGNEIGRVIWSPDSRRLAYLRVIDTPGRLVCALETRGVADASPVVLISDTRVCYSQAQSSWWLPDGRIVFAFAEPNFDYRDFNLWEIKVDAQSGKAIGHPERLTNWPGFSLQGVTGSSDGKRLAFLRNWFHTVTTIGDIDPSHPGILSHPHNLANEMDGDWPTAWTADSRAVIFYSVKGGDTDIFEQPLDKESPNPIVTGPGEQLSAILSPDSLWFIYMEVPKFQSYGLPNPVRLMKIPVSGGAPQLILTSDGYVGHDCSRVPSNVCIVSEQGADGRLVLSTFDPTGGSAHPGGKGPKLLTLEAGTGWAISPDGSTLATSKVDDHQIRFRFVSLRGGARDFEMDVKGWTRINSVHWASDGRSLFITSRSPSACTLLQVDLHGVAHVLSEQPGAFQMWAIPSPDGRRLAVFSASMSSEVWTAENF
jgi:DNA-binding winged helix-turn-helix (wHTH) protein/Tol biopolymer transport system component